MYQQEGYDLIGAGLEGYNSMGQGFLKEVSQECLEMALEDRGIQFERRSKLQISLKERHLTNYDRLDLYVCEGLVVKFKVIKEIDSVVEGQFFNYLRGSRKPVGYLTNLGHEGTLEWKRFIAEFPS